ncbi:MAG TPA: serine/threonine-protein kinase [Gemmataceae bacterium]|nr:serine/threonine-protein kinase [Gemmataceae bacterium]
MSTSVLSIGKFQVIGTLGTGAHSTILHVRRKADFKPYALKVVPIGSPEDMKFLAQAQHEFEIAQKLDHPNLIKIYALETVRDWCFRTRKVHLLIEYVNGRTLDTFPRIPMQKLIRIFVQVAEGMVHMHRRGVCHADLKPNNILLGRAGEVKVIDFGLARMKGEQKGRVQGTPEYMAPEQAKKGIVNERTDIYNFGVTMYRLVTLRLPPTSIADKLQVDAKTWQRFVKPVQECNSEAPAKLCELIHSCLWQDAHRRPERMGEIHGVLDHLADDLAGTPEECTEELEW